MPALLPTDFKCRIVWLGHNVNRATTLGNEAVQQFNATFAGPETESRFGLTRPSDGRLQCQYPRGTEVRNTRQISIISAEELEIIAANMGVKEIKPEWLGLNMVIKGLADFSHIPPSSRLISQNGTGLVIDLENRPCHLPAKLIDAQMSGKGCEFKTAATNLRGVTAWVEREGALKVGDEMILHIPDQPAWPHLDQVLRP
ncbi:MAG TPA: sulfurase [Rhodobacteraceae bacterium]|jgi:hypothetical protein|nr:sulfurase [Paracoccaceae bacterium]